MHNYIKDSQLHGQTITRHKRAPSLCLSHGKALDRTSLTSAAVVPYTLTYCSHCPVSSLAYSMVYHSLPVSVRSVHFDRNPLFSRVVALPVPAGSQTGQRALLRPPVHRGQCRKHAVHSAHGTRHSAQHHHWLADKATLHQQTIPIRVIVQRYPAAARPRGYHCLSTVTTGLTTPARQFLVR